MVHETFWGRPCVSGEDKRLTYLLQAQGHLTRYQDNVTVTTFAPKDLGTFLKQKLRWTRNSWRADLRAMSQRWIWKRPALLYFLFDKCISAFTTLIAPLFFTFALAQGAYGLAGAIVIWWLVSRLIKALPYLHKYPRDFWIVPVFVVFGFVLGLIRIFALTTMNRQGWLTRQRGTTGLRPAYGRAVVTLGAYAATSGVLAVLAWMVVIYRTWAVP
jgi:hyaluronan synthase